MHGRSTPGSRPPGWPSAGISVLVERPPADRERLLNRFALRDSTFMRGTVCSMASVCRPTQIGERFAGPGFEYGATVNARVARARARDVDAETGHAAGPRLRSIDQLQPGGRRDGDHHRIPPAGPKTAGVAVASNAQ